LWRVPCTRLFAFFIYFLFKCVNSPE
jgi:hypothetical protein